MLQILIFQLFSADFPLAEVDGPANLLVTREFKELFEEVFPDVIKEYEESRAAAKSELDLTKFFFQESLQLPFMSSVSNNAECLKANWKSA